MVLCILVVYTMIRFVSDRVRLSGPRIDGNYTLTFDVGEYEYDKIKDIPTLNNNQIYVSVSNNDEKEQKATT